MLSQDEAVRNLFDGGSLYSRVKSTLLKYGMDKMIEQGVLLGLSGGADSVMLLYFLLEYRRREVCSFNIVACHVNHLIRGDEAYQDMEFSRKLAEACGVEFVSREIDVPKYAREHRLGIEEAARDARYSFLNEILSGRNDINTIALAHNASDNLETVIFNMMRGAGLCGMCGIVPLRDNIVRPLIRISKGEILEALDSVGLGYVTDSTNLETDYTRNYIRHEITPRLLRLSSSPEAAISRLTESLTEDNAYLSSCAASVLNEISDGTPFDISIIRGLDYPILTRVLSSLIQGATGVKPTMRLLSDLIRCIASDNFEYSVGAGITLVCERGKLSFKGIVDKSHDIREFPLSFGQNKLDGYAACVVLSREKEDNSPNVYNFSIYRDVPSAIIKGELYLRFRREGDAYRYGGMTHKLKKVFNDREIPKSIRDSIPVICDDDGILWVPGLPVRDYEKDVDKSDCIRITVFYSSDNNNSSFDSTENYLMGRSIYTARLR